MAREKLSKWSGCCEWRITDSLKESLWEKTETLKKKFGSAIWTIVDCLEEREKTRLYRIEKRNLRKEIRDVINNEHSFLGLMNIVLSCFVGLKYRKSWFTSLWSWRYGSIKLWSWYDPTSSDLYLVRKSGEYSLSSDWDEYYIDGVEPKVRKSIKICSLRHILNLMLKQKIHKSSWFSKEEILDFFERLKNDSPLSLPEKIHYMTCFSLKLTGIKLE